MLVFWEQRLAFLATPKTGSTAIAAALERHAAEHEDHHRLLRQEHARRGRGADRQAQQDFNESRVAQQAYVYHTKG